MAPANMKHRVNHKHVWNISQLSVFFAASVGGHVGRGSEIDYLDQRSGGGLGVRSDGEDQDQGQEDARAEQAETTRVGATSSRRNAVSSVSSNVAQPW